MPTLHLHLLGDFRLTLDDMPVTGVNSARLRSLLAYLVLHRDAPQSRQHLAFLFFPDSTESRARANLRNLFYLLRQALPDPDRFLNFDAQTVQWQPDAPFTLDVNGFENAVTQATSSAALQEAVNTYPGDLLPGCYDDWILAQRDRLRQKFNQALEQLMLLLEEERDYYSAIRYAQRLLQSDPLREETYRHLMRLHALNGDRAGVVRFYNTCVTVLQRELEVEPSGETRDAYERLLKMDVSSRLAAGRVSPPSGASAWTNLPFQLTSFIGREREKREVKGLIAAKRLLTLTGVGGVGKTRLALAVAAELLDTFAEGAWLIDLAPLSGPGLIPQAVASLLRVRETPERPLLDTLADYVREKNLLLVLDNCEHMVEAVGHLAETLLHAAPRLRILATSREVLGIAGEVVWRVPALTVPDMGQSDRSAGGRIGAGESLVSILRQYEGVQLFADRAAAGLPTFTLTDANASAVGHICQRLDGIPLAIELAAARVKLLTVEQIGKRLDNSFRLLVDGSRTALPRQQTLLGAMDWSYVLLSKKEQTLFRRLSVFAGGFTLEAVEAVCGGEVFEEAQALNLLSGLVDKSLVAVEPYDGAARFRLLETMRQYARGKLLESGEAERVLRRHLAFFVQLAEDAEPKLRGAERMVWLSRLETEHDNLRSALEWARENDAESGLRLASALWRFWGARGHLREGRARLEVILSRADVRDQAPIRAKALAAAGNMAYYQGDYASARALIEQSLAIRQEVGDDRSIGDAFRELGVVVQAQGDYSAARALYEKSLAICEKIGDQWGAMAALSDLGQVAWNETDHTRARSFFERALEIGRALGDKAGIAYSLSNFGLVAWSQGEYDTMRTLNEESLTLYQELNDKWGIAHVLHCLGIAALAQGDYAGARAHTEKSLALFCQYGDKWGIAYALQSFAELAAAQGRLESISSADAPRGSTTEPLRAARLFGAAEALCQAIGAHVEPALRAHYEGHIAAVRGQLGEQRFAAAWAEGRTMTMDQAIALALERPHS